jgi:hypothetical protein
MRRIACKPSWIAALVVLLLAGCKSGDDDSDMQDTPSANGPDKTAEAGRGSDGSAGTGAAHGGSGSAGTHSGGSSAGASEAGSGATDEPGDSGNGGSDGLTPDEMPDPSVPLPMTPLSDLPQVFAGAICSALRDCLGDSKLRELTRREDCATAVGAELRAKDFAHMDTAVSVGHVLYDPEHLGECVDGIRALSCDVLTHTFPQPCVDVLDGNVAIDGECTITAECEGAAFCSTASCPSKCTALLAKDASCNADDQCADGLGCIGGKCTAASEAGEDCGGGSGKACALGLNCKGATDSETGSCVSNAEIQVGSEGDACEPGGALCKDGLSCVFAGGSAFHCEAAVGEGGACHLGLPGQCPPAQYCDATEVTAASTCRDLPGLDQPCVLNGLCKGGLVCIQDGDQRVCRAIADNGDECADDVACRSGRCLSGRCAPPLSCP